MSFEDEDRLLKTGACFLLGVYGTQSRSPVIYSFPKDSSAAFLLSYIGIFCKKPVMPSTL